MFFTGFFRPRRRLDAKVLQVVGDGQHGVAQIDQFQLKDLKCFILLFILTGTAGASGPQSSCVDSNLFELAVLAIYKIIDGRVKRLAGEAECFPLKIVSASLHWSVLIMMRY